MQQNQDIEASFSTLVFSIASSAMMNLGLADNPSSGKPEKDLSMAKFNIDLLNLLTTKTRGNLDEEEASLLRNITSDLQIKYVQQKKEG